MECVRREAYVKGLGTILVTRQRMDFALNSLKEFDAELISARQLAYARMKKGLSHPISEDSSFVREGILYDPQGEYKRILLRDSLVLKYPEAVIDAHRSHNRYYLQDFNVNGFLKTLSKEDYYILDPRVHDGKFRDDKTLRWIFGSDKYVSFRKARDRIDLDTEPDFKMDFESRPYINQLFLDELSGCSTIYADHYDLVAMYNFRGVRNNPSDVLMNRLFSSTIEGIIEYSEDFIPPACKEKFDKTLRRNYG